MGFLNQEQECDKGLIREWYDWLASCYVVLGVQPIGGNGNTEGSQDKGRNRR